MAEVTLTPFFDELFTPTYIGSFHTGLKEVKIVYFSSPDAAPQVITLNPFPFMTLYDLKVMIYQKFNRNITAHPIYQSLLVPDYETMDDEMEIPLYYSNFDFSHTTAESSNPNDVFTVKDPFTRVKGGQADERFVTESGVKGVGFADRSRITIEEYSKSVLKGHQLLLHLFLYKDVYPLLKSELRESEREWSGRMKPYFPTVALNQSPSKLPEAQEKLIQVFDTYVSGSVQQLDELDRLLQNVQLLPMVVAGCKYLRLVWGEPEKDSTSIETLFYKLNVTNERPFLRVLPVGASPITKIKMTETLKIPVFDPRLLLSWKDERNPKPDRDFMFSKIMVRKMDGEQPALYGTLRIFDGNSADFTVMPPKQLRVLNPSIDLKNVGELLTIGLRGVPIQRMEPDIGEANIVCAIRLPIQSKLLTSEMLRDKLPAFATLFQEIQPLPGDKPLIMLRFRAVSNYANEDSMFKYLTLLNARSKTKDQTKKLFELSQSLREAFQLTEEEAKEKMIQWMQNKNQIQLAIPETKDYVMTYNSGIDIAIYAQQSYYTLHLFGINSVQNFRRIITAVSLLLHVKQEAVAIKPQKAVLFQAVSNAVVANAPGSEEEDINASVIGAGKPTRLATSSTKRPAPGTTAAAAATADWVDDEDEEEDETLNLRNNTGGQTNIQGASTYMDEFMMAAMMGREEEDENQDDDILNMRNTAQNEIQNTKKVDEAAEIIENNREVAAFVAPQPAPKSIEEEEEKEEENNSGKKKSYQSWVKGQLQAADERLFMYKTDIGGLKIEKYVTKCQATESRQPYVLNQDQYQIMRDTYAADDDFFPIVYGWDEPGRIPSPGDEVVTLLKYGTNPSNPNYYVCCQFFCTKDYIIVREKDFYSNFDRQGKPKTGETAPGKKDRGSCPFCHGLEIRDLKNPKPNETVIQRRTKKGESKRHLYIGFLQGETVHPEGFYMPCCFNKDTKIFPSDPRFDKIRKSKEDEEEEEDTKRSIAGVPMISYFVTIHRAHKKYIVGPEKEVLKISDIDGPQIGLVPPVLDKYFGQAPKNYVSREANKMELLPNADCFLRVAVENRSPYLHDSFFAAIAPYLGFLNNAQQVKDRIKELFTTQPHLVRLFTFLNYGNLLLEFYDPNYKSEPTPEELKQWLMKNLQIKEKKDSNEDAGMRIWKSYHNFIDFLGSNKPKEYRQFAQMLALPNILTERGLVLIVLELNERNELSVRCPPFGYNLEQYADSDIGFILHRASGVWEPLFFSSNRAASSKAQSKHQPEIRFQRALEAAWPPVVKQRVNEFIEQCQGVGRGIYTSSSKIDPMALMPLQMAIKGIRKQIDGIVRDVYNHVVAVTFDSYQGQGKIALPVIDDETNISIYPLYLDWDDFKPAPMDVIVKFYQNYLQKVFGLYPKYSIKRRIKCRATDKYVALQLANGLYIPAGSPTSEESVASIPLSYLDEMEWSLNREIYFGKPSKLCKTEKELEQMKKKEKSKLPLIDTPTWLVKESDMEEVFQHLRITFSNWFSGPDVTGKFRQQIKDIIENNKKNLPLFERRKRLEVILGPIILSWMDTDAKVDKFEASLLRVDCRLETTKATCGGKCVWRKKEENDVGSCLIHSPKHFSVGGHEVNGTRLLMLRLLEELLRFPDKRNQIFNKNVTTLVSLKEAIVIGEQKILPEGSIAWNDLLRMDWIDSERESKKFIEEYSRKEEKREAPQEEISLPTSLVQLFGANDPKTKKLFVLLPNSVSGMPLETLLIPLGVEAENIGEEDIMATNLTEENLIALTEQSKRTILYFDTTKQPVTEYAFTPMISMKEKKPLPYIFVNTTQGLGVLSRLKDSYKGILPENMPANLLSIYEKSEGV